MNSEAAFQQQIDAADCYGWSRQGLSLNLLVTFMRPAATAEATEMQFGAQTRGSKEQCDRWG